SVHAGGYGPPGNMWQRPQGHTGDGACKDQPRVPQRQAGNLDDLGGQARQGGRTCHLYDAGRQRLRKTPELENGTLKEERIYLGGFEIFQQHTGTNAGLVRETLQVMDDKNLIALVETRTQGDDPGPVQLIRYQFGNHLGSANLELDHQAQ